MNTLVVLILITLTPSGIAAKAFPMRDMMACQVALSGMATAKTRWPTTVTCVDTGHAPRGLAL